jgi:hypothetical protein
MRNFWENSFAYIFQGYKNFGENASAHIYALSILSLTLQSNILAFLFLLLPTAFIKSVAFKIVSVVIFFTVLLANASFFLSKKRYLLIMAEYEERITAVKKRLIVQFWIYLGISVVCLALAIL